MAYAFLEPPRRDGENAQNTGRNGEKMGETAYLYLVRTALYTRRHKPASHAVSSMVRSVLISARWSPNPSSLPAQRTDNAAQAGREGVAAAGQGGVPPQVSSISCRCSASCGTASSTSATRISSSIVCAFTSV